jgi:hypothetical protein
MIGTVPCRLGGGGLEKGKCHCDLVNTDRTRVADI